MPTVIVPDVTVTLVHETCYRCGVHFAVPFDFMRNRRQDKESFWCPNGHSQAYVKSEADKLRDQLAAEKHAREQAAANAKYLESRVTELRDESKRKEARINGYKGQLTRVKRRSSQGRCL